MVLHYKERSAHKIWLPGTPTSAPKATNPEGIVIFGAPPPDPLATPPEEAELLSRKTSA